MNEEFSSLTRGKDILDQPGIIASEEELCSKELVKNCLTIMVPPIKIQKCLHVCKFPLDNK
jgi:hypothetical protein